MAQRVLFAAAVAFVAACSPFGGGAFSCERDDQCGATGKCTSGFCSFLDSSCASGYRYGEASGSLSSSCVADTTPTDGNAGTDAKVFHDAMPPGVTCFGTGFGKTCFKTENLPTAPAALTAQNIDTDASALCSNVVENNPGWCVIAATDLTITGTVTATGAKPLVLIATNELHVDGTLDVASHRAPAQVGAGAVPLADTTLCDPGTPPGNNGGGAGGSLGGAGGNGGNTNGGAEGAVKPTNQMRGGCAGQDGKSGTFGVKGFGGGVAYLIANVKITVGGSINASGAAGSAGVTGSAGGGGGGSGGLIGLDAPIVMNGGAIFANGGGGAEGSGNMTKGNDGNESANGNVAAASDGGSNGGGGGAGGALTAATDGGNGNGGGGGGGGVGAVKLFQAATIMGGVVSPPAS